MDQTPKTDAEKQAVVEAAAKAGNQDGAAVGTEEAALKFLSETLKRDFKSIDDATKMLTNLNSLVGDNAIAELREKAKDAENFEAVVRAYAKEEGVTFGDAKRTLLENVKASVPVKETSSPEIKSDDPLRAEFEKIKNKLQEKELIEAYPEAKAVLKELTAMAKSTPDKELREIYESSALKDALSKATQYDKSKEVPSASVSSSSRQYNFESDNFKKAIETLKANNFEGNQIAFVEAALKQLAG